VVDWWPGLRRLLFVLVLTTLITVIVGFVPAVKFGATAAYEHAGFASRVNGPIQQPFLASVRRSTGEAATGAVEVSVQVSVANRSALMDLYLLDRAVGQSSTWFTPPLRISGHPLSVHPRVQEMVIDASLAHRLHLRAGGEVTVDPGDGVAPIRVVVAGIYASSGPTKGAGVGGPGVLLDGVRQHLIRRQGAAAPAYSDLFIGVPGAHERSLSRRIDDLVRDEPELIAESRTDRLASARDEVTGLLGPTSSTLLPGGIALLVVTVLVREQQRRLRERRPELALLVRFGVPAPTACRMLILETMAEASVAGLVAVPLGRWLLYDRLQLFLPPSAADHIQTTFVGLVALVAFAGAIQLRWRVRSTDLAALGRED
jgi:hypothetical protein